MDVIKEVKARLAKYRSVAYNATKNSISVRPQDDDGFWVSLHVRGSEFTVSFDGWHETFRSANEALNCFVFGLSDACRLEVELRGRTATKWAVQSQQEGAWVTDSEVGLLLVPFWCRKRIVHRQNRLVPVE